MESNNVVVKRFLLVLLHRMGPIIYLPWSKEAQYHLR